MAPSQRASHESQQEPVPHTDYQEADEALLREIAQASALYRLSQSVSSGAASLEQTLKSAFHNVFESKNIHAVFSINDEMALGAAQAAEVLGRNDLLIVGYDASEVGLAGMRQGKIAATVMQHLVEIGRRGVIAALYALEGRHMGPAAEVPVHLVTADGEFPTVEALPVPATARRYKLGVALGDYQTNIGYRNIYDGVMQVISEAKLEAIVAGHHETRVQEQAAAVEAMLDQGVDALVVVPLNQYTLSPVVQRASSRGILVIELDQRISGVDVDDHVGADNLGGGRLAAAFVGEKLDGQGCVAVIYSDMYTAQQRSRGFQEAMAEHFPAITVLPYRTVVSDQEMGRQAIYAMLQSVEIDRWWVALATNPEEPAGKSGESILMGLFGQFPGFADDTMRYQVPQEHMDTDVAAQCLIESRYMVINNPSSGTRSLFGLTGDQRHRLGKFVLAPVMAQGRTHVVGVVCIGRESNGRDMGRRELQLAEALSSQITVMIRDYQAREALRRQNAYLKALHDTTLGLISQLDLTRLLESLVAQAAQLLDTSHGFIYLLNTTKTALDFKIGIGVFAEMAVPHFSRGEGLVGLVWKRGEPITVDQYDSWSNRSPQFASDTIRAAMGSPLVFNGEVVGVLGMAYDMQNRRTFGTAESELLTRFAELASIALHNAWLYAGAQTAQEAAEAANRAKSAFLTNVSHELRTPLTSVLGFAKIIKKRMTVIQNAMGELHGQVARAMEQINSNLDIIMLEGERLTALINDVLDLAKIESGKLEWKMRPIAVRRVIEQAVAVISSLLARSPLKLIVEVEDDLPLILGDHDRLVQVMVNLLSNAIKFTDTGTITCRAVRLDDHIQVNVIDTGIGINPDHFSKVFEQFVQVGDTLTGKPRGTGLGLPITRQIIVHHGGQIRVESTPGAGSTFTFVLPIASFEDRKIEVFPPETKVKVIGFDTMVDQLKLHLAAVALDNLREHASVLVVDDDSSMREMLRQELEAEGYAVREAASGQDALALIRTHRPDLITLDVMMPGLSGFDVLTDLRTSPETMGIPVIIVSVIEDKERGYRLGVDRYFVKPLDTHVLLREIRQLLLSGTARKRVLIIDDNQETVSLLMDMLKLHGYDVVAAYASDDGFERAVAARPDIVIIRTVLAEQGDLVQKLRVEKVLESAFFFLYE